MLLIFLTCNIAFAEQNNINVTNKTKSSVGDSMPSTLSQSDILVASNSVKSYINRNGKLPDYVRIGKNNFSIPEFLYLSAKTISYKYSKSNSQVYIKYNVKDPKKPTGNSINIKITKKNYYNLAKNVANFINKNNVVPNYATSYSKKIQYQILVYGFCSILSYNYNNKVLPSYLSLNFKSSSSLNKYIPKYSRSNLNLAGDYNEENHNGSCIVDPYALIPTNSILNASSNVKNYIETYGRLPNSVILDNAEISLPLYLYSLTQVINEYAYENPPKTSLVIKLDILNPTNPSGSSINSNLNFTEYYDVSRRIENYMVNNKIAPNYVLSQYGYIQYQTAIYGLTKIVDYINKNKALPKYLSITVKSTDSLNQYLPKL